MLTYLINEIYPCLQGEGANLGHPSLLIRFQICNLRCSWCDTPYTHTLKSDPVDLTDLNSPQKFKRFSLNDLCEQIKKEGLNHLILTGGEPTLQNLALIMKTLGKNYSAEVESNGTQIPHKKHKSFELADYSLFQWNISPKFSNAGEVIETEALKFWSELAVNHPKVYFKFVIRKDNMKEDFSEILKIIEEYSIPKRSVYLMPEGTNVESQLANIWLHDLCLKYQFKYTTRLHILLFGHLRGV